MLYRFMSYLVMSAVLAVGLSGCAIMNPHYASASQDGSPNFDVDASQIPDAVPQVEHPQSGCNPDHYRVHGRTYRVLRNASHYHEKGLASWYGTRFYKGKTSSGEPYNVLAMTAAHKTLPIPCYVKVTHLKTGRHIIVKVNDRGPFKPHRVIDLSYVAAKKLGITKTGTAPVEVSVIQPSDAQSLNQPSLPLSKKPKKLKKTMKKKRGVKHSKTHKNKAKKVSKTHRI